MQEENHQKSMEQRDSTGENEAAFVVTTPKFASNFQRPTCKHCGGVGHEEQSCYELTGYPTGWVPRGGGRDRGRSRSMRGGREDARRGRGQASVYVGHTTVEPHTINKTEKSLTLPMVPGLSVEQVQRLLSLIDSPKPSNKKLLGNGDWLLDSGTTCHMTGDLNKLFELHDIHLILVKIGKIVLRINKEW